VSESIIVLDRTIYPNSLVFRLDFFQISEAKLIGIQPNMKVFRDKTLLGMRKFFGSESVPKNLRNVRPTDDFKAGESETLQYRHSPHFRCGNFSSIRKINV